MSASDESNLRHSQFNQFHLNYDPVQVRLLVRHCATSTTLSSRYGSWSSLAQYVQEAQAQDCENTQAQFEAFIAHATTSAAVHRHDLLADEQGLADLWTLYNNDGDQVAATSAPRRRRSLHAIYALDNARSPWTASETPPRPGSQSGQCPGLARTVLDDRPPTTSAWPASRYSPGAPTVPTSRSDCVELQLRQSRTLASAPSAGCPQPTWSTGTRRWTQPRARVSPVRRPHRPGRCRSHGLRHRQHRQPAGPHIDGVATTVTITNTSSSTVGFLLRADVRRGTAGGQELSGDNELQSSLWQNNDITLFPGESQTLTVTWNSADLQGATAVVSVSGWNVPKIDILA